MSTDPTGPGDLDGVAVNDEPRLLPPRPDIDPDADLPDQLAALEMWLGLRLDARGDYFQALKFAHAYVQCLAYRAEQISQQLDISLIPPDPRQRITSPYGSPALRRWPRPDRRYP